MQNTLSARTLAALLATPLACMATACSSTTAPGGSGAQPPIANEDVTGGSCDAKAASAHVGQMLDEQVAAQAKAAAGARGVRIIRPGMAVTMDYRAGRLNLEVDDQGRIIRASCG
ncbi:MAG TPA: I78 family peptidase inhibitor [Luteimonas sp.]